MDHRGEEVKVTRSKGIQMEMVNGELFTLKLEWIGDCQYKMWEYQEDNNYKKIGPTNTGKRHISLVRETFSKTCSKKK